MAPNRFINLSLRKYKTEKKDKSLYVYSDYYQEVGLSINGDRMLHCSQIVQLNQKSYSQAELL